MYDMFPKPSTILVFILAVLVGGILIGRNCHCGYSIHVTVDKDKK